jgi:metallophosphoesterase (TIGR00282 family)
MRLLFIGDVVGRAGRAVLLETLPELRRAWSLDCVIVNGENAAGGFGITETICGDFLAAGADCVTLGNHAFDQREAQVFITREPRLVRPLNYPRGTPGRGAALVETAAGASVLVVNLMGRVFMDAMDDPFAAIERELDACPLGAGCDAAVVDFHAEASSEKQAFAHFVDGRVSLVVGTHTHVPTADHRILPHGTGYMTDAGMTGDYESVIGMEKDEPIRRFTTKLPSSRFEPATGAATLCGVAAELDNHGLAIRIAPVRIGGKIAQAKPDFWAKAPEPVV